jgi:hypothetical protein
VTPVTSAQIFGVTRAHVTSLNDVTEENIRLDCQCFWNVFSPPSPFLGRHPTPSNNKTCLQTSNECAVRVFASGLSHNRYPGWATSVTPHSTASDPAETEAVRCLEQGTAKLEEGDVQAAKELYERSASIRRNASSLFNLGVTHYHLSSCIYPRIGHVHPLIHS